MKRRPVESGVPRQSPCSVSCGSDRFVFVVFPRRLRAPGWEQSLVVHHWRRPFGPGSIHRRALLGLFAQPACQGPHSLNMGPRLFPGGHLFLSATVFCLTSSPRAWESQPEVSALDVSQAGLSSPPLLYFFTARQVGDRSHSWCFLGDPRAGSAGPGLPSEGLVLLLQDGGSAQARFFQEAGV